MKVYGPYTRKDGRRHVIHYDGTHRRTQSYPRYLMEQFLGRSLAEWEQVDHINEDPTDDRLENFQLLTRSENTKKSIAPAEVYQFICPVCGTWAERIAHIVRYNQRQGKAGPFCGKRCARKFQLGPGGV